MLVLLCFLSYHRCSAFLYLILKYVVCGCLHFQSIVNVLVWETVNPLLDDKSSALSKLKTLTDDNFVVA